MTISLVAVIGILAIVLVIRRKEWFLGIVCTIFGVLLAATSWGHNIVHFLDMLNEMVRSWIK